MKNCVIKVLTLIMAFMMVFTLVGCGDDPVKENVKMSMSFDKDEYVKGEKVIVNVTITGTENTDYELKIDDKSGTLSEIVKINSNSELEIIGNPESDRIVKVIATSKADETVQANDSFIVKHTEVLEPTKNVKITLTADKTVLQYGQTAKLTVTIENSEDKSYTYRISNNEYIKVVDDEVIVLKKPKFDVSVSVVAIANSSNIARSTVTFIIKPQVNQGSVEDLTSDMLKEIGNENITVNGVLTDYYQNFRNSAENAQHQYDMTVKMTKDAWNGTWSIKGQPENAVTDIYRKSEKDGLIDENNNVGHGLLKLFINKNNEVESDFVKNYLSIPTLWEQQHLWNHISNLDINRFSFDKDKGLYVYTLNENSEEDLYLMTYLSFSLTPVLEDTLVNIYLTVENGKISKFIGQTEVLYYGDDPENPDAMSYSLIELTFENIGTTVVEDPQKYEAPEHVDILEKALKKMQTQKNYTFRAVDTLVRKPESDPSDYEIESVSQTTAKNRITRNRVNNYTSETGTVGTYGQITEEAVLFAVTDKYDSTMDGKAYHTEYSGYIKIDANSYDQFAYDYTLQTLVGQRKRYGSMFDVLPGFNLSPNIFQFEVASKSKAGKNLYEFSLLATSVTKDVAEELSCYKYVNNACESTQYKLSITVDEDGNLVKSFYPYEFSSYFGYVTTTYSNFDTTEIELDTFDGYVPREIKTKWSQYNVMYYKANYDDANYTKATADVVLKDIFGDSAADMPDPSLFIEIFGDNMSGPFFDITKKGNDEDGQPIYKKGFSITLVSSEYDENARITNYEELMNTLITKLKALGYEVSQGNTDMSGGATGRGNKYLCMIKGDIQIVVENIGTKYLYFDFVVSGDWTLKK